MKLSGFEYYMTDMKSDVSFRMLYFVVVVVVEAIESSPHQNIFIAHSCGVIITDSCEGLEIEKKKMKSLICDHFPKFSPKV